MRDLENMRIYKLAVEIGELVWQLVVELDKFSKWTIGKQITESADGIGATMIEGYYRFSKNDQARFFQYALSSAKETSLWLWKMKNRNLINDNNFNEIINKINDLIPQTISYIKSLKKE
ncbi:MAG: four helix bundle protein [Ignavibacteriales bacterium]|nr:four helix bundle protein [Ignavibacteriales bacterium]